MPTKLIKVCARCGKVSCDGSIWRFTHIYQYNTTTVRDYREKVRGVTEIDLSTIPEENMESCTLDYGTTRRKMLKDKKLGDEVRLEFNNWTNPSWVYVRKIEE